ncbi:DNA/RNA non-specific endonuclease [Flavobacterium sp.]|jgi:endonuclease G|uniref:DNA/RNA non-specific endonuclease n=1 Tax=Flavobacterium sp. TaxID=239 RepID=UPI003D27B80B
MINYNSFISFLLIISFTSCKHIEIENLNTEEISDGISGEFNFLPTSTSGKIYSHDAYSFSYVEKHEQAEWVAYELNDSDFSNTNNYNRPYFNQDPLVGTKSADWRNYKKSGYNKGHLCPAGDRKKSYELYKETFFTSNASPQLYKFNAGIWNRLEQKTRYWASKYDGVYVITGGVLVPNLKTIGEEKVSVPNYFYKILLTKDKKRMIGFLLPHRESEKSLYEFAVSVDEIEKVTGIDFFPELEDFIEDELERNSNYKKWSF